MRTLSPLSLDTAAPLIKRSGSRTLLRRLAVPPPTRTQPRGGAASCPPASPPVIREEATEQGWGGEQPELRRSRRGLKEQQSTVLGALVSACLAVLYWCLGALGQTARARAVWDAAVGRVRTLRAGWAARLEAGTKMGRALSSAALDALGRGVTKAEKVSGFMRRAMSLESKMDTQGAIRAYQAASDLVPDDVGPLLGLAKCISDRVFEPAIYKNGELARSMATQATVLSERALKLKPDNPRAHLTSAVTLGRLALWSNNQRKIEISRTVRERVVAALTLSPNDDVALHVLGRWEYEMAVLGWAVRLVVKTIYGGLEVGSMDEAHRCLARAIEINPERLVHRVVMARILLKQNKRKEAVKELETAIRLPIEDVNAVHERADAVKMLASLGRTPSGGDAAAQRAQPAPAFA